MGNIIYHYTSQKGFEGIVREDGIHLWFSDVRYMNDSSELINAKKFLIQAADELLNEKKIDEDIYNTIQKIEYNPKKFDSIKCVFSKNPFVSFQISSANYHKFVCCFSSESDSLPMWNYYLKGDEHGYAIGINLDGIYAKDCEIIGDIKNENDYCFDDGITSMIYSDKEKISIFRSEILDFSKDMITYKGNEQKQTNCIVNFQKAFETYSLGFKDYHFSYENEQRIMITVKESKEIYINGKRRNDIKFRLSHGLVIPYFELYIPQKNILKEISISPKIGLNSDDKSSIESMRFYLKHLGYVHDINIRCSEIPLRYY